MHVFQIKIDEIERREFPVQLAEHRPDYWIFIDVSEFKGQTINLSGPSSQAALNAIYQADTIEGASTLYKEPNRPQFHFTVKRGWSNDVNGPIFYKGQFHLFWQALPFGVTWDTGFMYWGHAVSKDLIHWQERSPALMLDHLGSPWSGSSVVDHNNDGGWGKDALVLFYTAFDRKSKKQVQCIAYRQRCYFHALCRQSGRGQQQRGRLERQPGPQGLLVRSHQTLGDDFIRKGWDVLLHFNRP
jgi:fructan beta-fructosidase